MTKLTDKVVRELTCARDKQQVRLYDGELPGFGVRVTRSGARSFFLNYTIDGRERRKTIGGYPAWSVGAARKEGAKLRVKADMGEDPLEESKIARERMTVGSLWQRYREECLHSKAERTQANEISMWDRLVLPEIGRRALKSLRPEDFDRLHKKISDNTPVQANRCIASVHHVMNKACRWGLLDRNPAHGVRRNQEEPRSRYLSSDELKRFVSALRSREVTSSTLAIEFLLLTGCRKGEALRARWSEFDLDRAVWTKPSAHTKQRKSHRLVLSNEALNVLKLARQNNDGAYVFPGRTGEPLNDIRKTFRAVCHHAELRCLRVHDLRHSFASILASGGVSLPLIGQLLGHTQVSTTNRYSHLMDESLRSAAAMVGDSVS